MARFKTDFMVNRPDADQFIQFVTLDFLQKEGFAYVDFEGEMVWKKGTGALAAMQFIKVEHSGGQVHLEAWLRTVKLPGVYGKEMDFSGAWGFAVKQSFHSSINQLIGLLQQPQMVADGAQQAPPVQQNIPPTQEIQQNDGFAQQAPPVQNAQQQAPPVQQNVPPTQGTQQNGGFAQQAPPMQQNAQQQAQIPVVVHNTSGSATISLVMGLVSIIGLWVPIIGVICGIIGISSGVKGRRSPAKGLATAGLVISIVFLVLAIISWIAGAVRTVLLLSNLY